MEDRDWKAIGLGPQERHQFTIEHCPICGDPHEYDVAVRMSLVMRMLPPPPRQFTRFFTCPAKGEMFQDTITVSGSVEDFQVEGVHRAETDAGS